MKSYFPYLVLGILMFILLLPEKPKPIHELFLSNPPDFSQLYYNSCPEVFKGDTNVNLSIFNFSGYETKLPEWKKKKLIDRAVTSTISESKIYNYISEQYWKADTAKNDFEPINCKACSYEDFYFKDLDNDGDLDIIYSSLLNDYLNDDSNELMLFRNDRGRYKLHRISGFAQQADFKFQQKGYILFDMVSPPCCEEICYHFSIVTFNLKTWTSTSKQTIAISSNKVKLMYPAKDYL